MKEIISKTLVSKIERLEAFEERLQVKLEHLSLKIHDTGWIQIFCELHSNKGTTIKDDIVIECVVYGLDSSILGREECWISSDNFFGFEVIEMSFMEDEICDKISKIRIYPKKS